MLARMQKKVGLLVEKESNEAEKKVLALLFAGLSALLVEEKKFYDIDDNTETKEDDDEIALMIPSHIQFNFKLYASAFRKFSRAISDLKKLNPSFSLTELEDERLLLFFHGEVLKERELSYEDLVRYRDFRKTHNNGLQLEPDLKEFLLAVFNPAPLKLIKANEKKGGTVNDYSAAIEGFKEFERQLAAEKAAYELELARKEKEQEIARQTANIVCVEQGAGGSYRLFQKPRAEQVSLHASVMPRRPAGLQLIEEYDGSTQKQTQTPTKPAAEKTFPKVNLAVALNESYKEEPEDTLTDDDFEMVAVTPKKPQGRGRGK